MVDWMKVFMGFVIVFTIGIGITALIQIIIGGISHGQCPGFSKLAAYNITSGVVTLVAILVISGSIYSTFKRNDHSNLAIASLILWGVMWIFLLVWTIIGLVWISEASGPSVQFTDSTISTYCNKRLIDGSLGLAIAYSIFYFSPLAVLYSYAKPS